jgi:hypothetical protein
MMIVVVMVFVMMFLVATAPTVASAFRDKNTAGGGEHGDEGCQINDKSHGVPILLNSILRCLLCGRLRDRLCSQKVYTFPARPPWGVTLVVIPVMVVMVPMIMVSPAITAIRFDDATGGGEESDDGHHIQDEFHEFHKIPVLVAGPMQLRGKRLRR